MNSLIEVKEKIVFAYLKLQTENSMLFTIDSWSKYPPTINEQGVNNEAMDL